MNIKVGVTSRHIHLSEEDLYELFGYNYELSKLKRLSQDNNFSCLEMVDLINEGNEIKNVRIVGPTRHKTQVEISKTDAYLLKINPPVRNSGDLDGACKIKIKGPNKIIERNCCIIPTRHIHLNVQDAQKLNYNNGDIVKVRLFGEKSGIIDNVHIKLSLSESELHLDLDDSNAHLISNNDIAEILED